MTLIYSKVSHTPSILCAQQIDIRLLSLFSVLIDRQTSLLPVHASPTATFIPSRCISNLAWTGQQRGVQSYVISPKAKIHTVVRGPKIPLPSQRCAFHHCKTFHGPILQENYWQIRFVCSVVDFVFNMYPRPLLLQMSSNTLAISLQRHYVFVCAALRT